MSAVAGERPILFSGPMIRAILAGRKTQTRRILRSAPSDPRVIVKHAGDADYLAGTVADEFPTIRLFCPYGQPGDTLWVRETWAQKADGSRVVAYAADGHIRSPVDAGGDIISAHRGWLMGLADPTLNGHWMSLVGSFGGKWRPSIFMPRWASRLTLRVTSVRVERLQDISEADAEAEGVLPFFEQFTAIGRDQRVGGRLCADHPHWASFVCLWDEINDDRGAWATNPWVWVVTFERIGGPS